MRIEWSQAALADLDRIQEYIEQESPAAAERIWVRIYERVARQVDMPLAAPLHGAGPARRLVISGTAYLVFYVVDGDVLRVEQVLHAAQNG
jgi:addiction module RelE/StbE family toxin